ncbi:MAG: carbohydrate ABC transporter substrate-binding protein [Devosia sp.]|nr:carbohydrate ABC transporter substrate-binding protein [Devosia sp.]
MTWSHPRGYDPMVATARLWQELTGVEIAWDKRSLQDFETFPVEELARAYDLIVIDHPHVGQVTAEACLAPLDERGRETELAAIAAGDVGGSFRSYQWGGRQWALPIDAAAQVQLYRPDRVAPARSWEDVIGLGKAGELVLPMLAPHSLMCFFTIAGGLGTPCHTGPGELIEGAAGIAVFERLRELAALIEPSNFAMDPIMASEAMARADAVVSAMPYGYGYVSYATEGFRPARLKAADIPDLGRGPVGSALGGTGIAVSAFSDHHGAALDHAFWVASGPVQQGLYAASGGQPGHAAGWESELVNARVDGFYRDTRATLEGAFLRPRHNGYMGFQSAASARLNAGLIDGEPAATVIADLNRLYRESQ